MENSLLSVTYPHNKHYPILYYTILHIFVIHIICFISVNGNNSFNLVDIWRENDRRKVLRDFEELKKSIFNFYLSSLDFVGFVLFSNRDRLVMIIIISTSSYHI
jgi:hypothetical protein